MPSSAAARLTQLLANETDMAFRRRARVLISFLNPQPNDNILDNGCGRGFFLSMVRELSPCRLTGVELDPEVFALAQKNLNGKRVELYSAKAESLPFAENTFDKVLFSEVIEHIPDDMAALRELYRVVKPGGEVCLSTPNARYPFCWDPINRTLEWLGLPPIRRGILAGIWANHERLYERRDLLEKVRTAGFEVVDCRTVTYFCFPFIHNIVYGIGKELLIRNLLPQGIANSADRLTPDKNTGSLLNPINFMRALFLVVDRLNDIFPVERSSVHFALRLRKATVST
jgi:ubiquinone/menaquinone biosynthesis C-methylase UbiE